MPREGRHSWVELILTLLLEFCMIRVSTQLVWAICPACDGFIQ